MDRFKARPPVPHATGHAEEQFIPLPFGNFRFCAVAVYFWDVHCNLREYPVWEWSNRHGFTHHVVLSRFVRRARADHVATICLKIETHAEFMRAARENTSERRLKIIMPAAAAGLHGQRFWQRPVSVF